MLTCNVNINSEDKRDVLYVNLIISACYTKKNDISIHCQSCRDLVQTLINEFTMFVDCTQWSGGRALAWCVGGHEFDFWLGHTKDFKNGT